VPPPGHTGKKKKKAPQPPQPDPSKGHTDAVMGLAWNRLQANAFASASADHTVRIWDLSAPALPCVQILSHHSDKVQAVSWHPNEASVLLSGSFDRTAAVVDVRAPSAHRSFHLDADAESAVWADDARILVSSEDGHVVCFDVRAGGRAWTLSAHDKAATSLAVSPRDPSVFATCSTDKTVKVWSVVEGKPRLLAAKEAQLGALFDVSFAADGPHLLAIGGSVGKVGVWDLTDAAAVCDALRLGRRETPVGGSIATSGMRAVDVHTSDSETDEEEGAAAAAHASAKKAAARTKGTRDSGRKSKHSGGGQT